jgi:hypothetical protein
MIGKLLRGGAAMLVYACVATVVSQAILAAYFAAAFRLDREKMVQMLAIAYGIDVQAMKEEAEQERERISAEQPSCDQILERRALKTRNIEIREQGLHDGVDQLRLAQRRLSDETKRYKQLKNGFDVALSSLRDGATAAGGEEVRRILESVKPKQAKELIVQMLDDKKLDEVVVLLAAMPDSKRAKIIGEFKTPEENVKVGEVLRRLRAGVPTAELAEGTRQELEQPQPPGR